MEIQNKKHKLIAVLFDNIFKLLVSLFTAVGVYRNDKEDLSKLDFKNILVIEQEPLGDAIMSTAVFSHLKKKYTKAKISVLTGSWAKDIFKHNPYIDEVIVHDTPWAFSRQLLGFKGFFEHLVYFIKLPVILEKIQSKKFDLAIDLRGDFRNILSFIFLPRIKHSLSFNRAGGEYLLSCAVPFNTSEHEIDKNFTLLKYLGIDTNERKSQIYNTPENEAEFDAKMERLFIEKDSKFCVIHPGAGNSLRVWPEERYAEISDYIAEKGFKTAITGTKNEAQFAIDIFNAALKKDKIINLSGKLNINEMGMLLKKAKLLICPDTSIMHLAAAFETPNIALIGPGDPALVGAKQKNIVFVDKKFDCRPCIQQGCSRADDEKGPGACIDAITVEDVIKEINKLLK